MSSVTMRQMLEAGVHSPPDRSGTQDARSFRSSQQDSYRHLEKSLPMFQDAQKFVRQLAANKATSCSSAPSAPHVTSCAKKRSALACLT